MTTAVNWDRFINVIRYGPMGSTKIWTIHGDGWRSEKRICGIWFGRERREQKWATLMSEVEWTRYVRIGNIRLAWSDTRCVFKDGKEPRVIRGPH